LPVHGGRPVAELGHPDVQLVAAVVSEPRPGPAVVAARRSGGDHRHRHAVADQPTGGRHLLLTGRLGTGPGDQIQALVQAVAVHLDGVVVPDRGDQRIVRPDHVAGAEGDRVESEPAGQLVDRRFDGERHLAQTVAAKRP